jgi:hypothetical protein
MPIENTPKRVKNPDVEVINAGPFFLFFPRTDRAMDWFDVHTDPDNRTWYAGGIVVEPRYAKDFANEMVEDGLSVR